MNERYAGRREFESQIRRMDRIQENSALRLEHKIESGFERAEFQRQILAESVNRKFALAEERGARLEDRVSRLEDRTARVEEKTDILTGEVHELKGEVSGLKDSIESLKHFMMWGIAVIGLLATVMPYIISVIVPHTGG